MSKVTIIIGPRGSGKTRKMNQITAGKTTVIQTLNRPFKTVPFENVPDFYVFEELPTLNDPDFVKIIRLLASQQHVTAPGKGLKPAPHIILISQCTLDSIPAEFKRDAFEIINLYQFTPAI